MAIEIKLSTAPTLSRGFHSAIEALGPAAAYVVHGGNVSWPVTKGVTAMSLIELMRKLSTP